MVKCHKFKKTNNHLAHTTKPAGKAGAFFAVFNKAKNIRFIKVLPMGKNYMPISSLFDGIINFAKNSFFVCSKSITTYKDRRFIAHFIYPRGSLTLLPSAPATATNIEITTTKPRYAAFQAISIHRNISQKYSFKIQCSFVQGRGAET